MKRQKNQLLNIAYAANTLHLAHVQSLGALLGAAWQRSVTLDLAAQICRRDTQKGNSRGEKGRERAGLGESMSEAKPPAIQHRAVTWGHDPRLEIGASPLGLHAAPHAACAPSLQG